MDKETYADNHPPHPPAAIPLIDSEHNLLPLQFVLDPGEEIFEKKDSMIDDAIRKLTISEKEKLKILKQYLEVSYINIAKNDNELPLDDKNHKVLNKVLEKSRTLPSSFESDDSCSDAPSASSVGGIGSMKVKAFSSKAAKQILMITKHFGSLGRMSKRIKKNLGTLAKRSTSFRSKSSSSSPRNSSSPTKKTLNDTHSKGVHNNNCSPSMKKKLSDDVMNGSLNDRDSIIVAVLHTEKRHEYHDEMIRNYLCTARARFLRQQIEKASTEKRNESPTSSSAASSTSAASNEPKINSEDNSIGFCVNTGCKMFGTQEYNYLCSSCFADQKEELIKNQTSNGDKQIACDKSDSNSKVFSSKLENNMKVPLTSRDNDDIVIRCANSHFYVATST